MKERPVIFSGPMVRAILDGRKTQTRRIVKDTGYYAIDSAIHGNEVAERELKSLAANCPYGEIGDLLWVRETWAIGEDVDPVLHQAKAIRYLRYRSDGGCLEDEWHNYGRWRSPIYMPRWASRITLEITGIRVERLQDISETDAKAEGCKESVCLPGDCGTFVPDFFNRWAEINGVESYEANPWVWVIEFKKVV